MAGSTFGNLFRLTTFGESHGLAIGGVIDGVPPGIPINLPDIQSALDRRRPGQSNLVTARRESDEVEFLSGFLEGRTTGAPIGFLIRNKDARSKDYEHLEQAFRPSHADYTYFKKYGIRDHRGGGRSSARETASRVVGGALAAQILQHFWAIRFSTYVDQVGTIRLQDKLFYTSEAIEQSPVRCPEINIAKQMEALIKQVKKEGNTVGGCITCLIEGVPAGWGEPVFDKLHADLAKATMSINAVKGVEFGSGFSSAEMMGSEHNDIFLSDGRTSSNFSGGIQGGISNGMPIKLRVAFKPVSTILQLQKSINAEGKEIELTGKGRHDPCVVPRAVPIVEAMVAMTILDHALRQQINEIPRSK
jgi:chorismate synthase